VSTIADGGVRARKRPAQKRQPLPGQARRGAVREWHRWIVVVAALLAVSWP